jgi:predicted GH43/DUF377 family glycosyl hydrolase
MITHRAALKTSILATLGIAFSLAAISGAEITEKMRWTDTSRGKSIAKDPSVVHFKDRYLMYYSLPPFDDKRPGDGWAIGIAESRNLSDWNKVGELLPSQPCEHNGLAAPGAWIRDGKVHIFYCTYGNWEKDAICHAWSDDGITFTSDSSNPIFAPSGEWTSGRAIDPEVFPVGDRLLLFFATRDPEMKVQMLGVASAPLDSDFSRAHWKQLVNGPILKPQRPWERRCIEAPTLLRRGDTLWMFYAGGYNNEPQQIGVATSIDGLTWSRLSDQPLVPNGQPGSWNSSESGHPAVLVDLGGRTHLFFQGNQNNGRSWYLSKLSVEWVVGRPVISP